MKFLRDLSDYLDAELVSNIVTAAMAVFIETGAADPYVEAARQATITDTGYKSDGSTYDQRYQELEPGAILYGESGQKPHLLAAQRPGHFRYFPKRNREIYFARIQHPSAGIV